jgi:hypothetical protein
MARPSTPVNPTDSKGLNSRIIQALKIKRNEMAGTKITFEK